MLHFNTTQWTDEEKEAARADAQLKLQGQLAARRTRKMAAAANPAPPAPPTPLRQNGFVALWAAIPPNLILDASRALYEQVLIQPEQSVVYVENGCVVCTDSSRAVMASIFDPLVHLVQELVEKEQQGQLQVQSASAAWCTDGWSQQQQPSSYVAVLLGAAHPDVTTAERHMLCKQADRDESAVHGVVMSVGDCLVLEKAVLGDYSVSVEPSVVFLFSFEVAQTEAERNSLQLAQLVFVLPEELREVHSWQSIVPAGIFAGRRIRLLRAPCYFQLQQQCPTGSQVWKNALVVAAWLEQHALEQLRGHAVLELGAGFHGTLGIVASRLGASEVMLTDSEKIAVECLQVNAAIEVIGSPAAKIGACKLDWAWASSARCGCDCVCLRTPDVVLVSDPLVWPQLAPILLSTLERLLIRADQHSADCPIAFVGWESRESRIEAEQLFLELVSKSQLSMEFVQLDHQPEQRLVLLRQRDRGREYC